MKSVAIVGGGSTRKIAPWDDPACEIWQLNEAAGLTGKRADAVIQIHDPAIYKDPLNRVDPNHWEWLKQLHGIKIYMQNKDPEVPDSVKYPLNEIVDHLLKNCTQMGKRDRNLKPIELFTFSGTYMVALAIHLGYSKIKIYGMDLVHTEEYRYQRESFAFWIGFAAGYGVEVEVYGSESIFRRPLYGYETFKDKRLMEFSIEDRIMLHDMVLPREADMVTMRIIREFRRLIEFDDNEVAEFQIRAISPGAADPLNEDFVNNTQGLQYMWNEAGRGYKRDIEIGEVTRKVVQESFKKFDKEGKFTEELLNLYEKFTYE